MYFMPHRRQSSTCVRIENTPGLSASYLGS
jgi:hypothetical protein